VATDCKESTRLVMITKLTPKQEAQIPVYIDKYVKLASQPTDRTKATQAVHNMYESMGEEKPIVIFGQSPFATAVMAAIFFGLKGTKGVFKKKKLYSQLCSQLDSQLYSQLYSQLGSQLCSQLDSQLGSQLDSQLGSQLDSQLYSQLGSQLRSQLYSQLRSQLYSQLDSQLGSQLDSLKSDWLLTVWWLTWAGWYAFGKYIGVKFEDKTYSLFMDFVSNIGLSFAYKGIFFTSEAPKISWENGMLHSETGKSVEYADGWGLYTLRGVSFDNDVELYEKIVSKKITGKEVMQIQDVDKRTIAISMLKPDELLKQLNAVLIDRGVEGTNLYECKNFMDTGKTEFCILMTDWSTPRQFVEFVPPEIGKIRSAVHAQASAYGIPDEDYLTIKDRG
jgi:hypothetical protein